jgi:fructose-1,6-bisphosphatase II
MPTPQKDLPPLRSTLDLERLLEFEFVRATENAALQAIHWLGRGEKELADAAACAAIYGVFDLLDICGEVVIGEGIKDNAPGIFVGEHLGTWKHGAPHFDIALDPIDGTSNIAKGLPNSIAVIAAAQVPEGAPSAMKSLPSFYSHKLAYGPAVKRALGNQGNPCLLDIPMSEVIAIVAQALGKHQRDVVVCTMDRPRHADIIAEVRKSGAALRMVTDGDIAAAVAPLAARNRCRFVCWNGRQPRRNPRRSRSKVPGRRYAAAHVVSQRRAPCRGCISSCGRGTR